MARRSARISKGLRAPLGTSVRTSSASLSAPLLSAGCKRERCTGQSVSAVHVCDACNTQSFEPKVEAAIRVLVATGFPDRLATREVIVPVFELDAYYPAEKVAAE